MNLFLLLASVVMGAGFVIIVHGIYTAPEGYEDEFGFHALTPNEKRESRTQMELSLNDHSSEISIAPAGMAMHS